MSVASRSASATPALGRVQAGLYAVVMVLGLALAVVGAFAYREMALASRFDPECPDTGCYASFGPILAPMVSLVGLVIGAVLAWSVVRTRRRGQLIALLWVVVTSCVAVLLIGAGSLVD